MKMNNKIYINPFIKVSVWFLSGLRELCKNFKKIIVAKTASFKNLVKYLIIHSTYYSIGNLLKGSSS